MCGVDFDNTIVSYNEVLARIARERGVLAGDVGETKRSLRDRIRQLPDGEIEWQKCQALVYGPRIGEAVLIPGVEQFFKLCHRNRIKVSIVSHKTEFSQYDSSGTNLRTAALEWMEGHGFFEPKGLGLSERDVYFACSRQEKIDRIASLECTDFIDDLEEIFLETTFPQTTTRILYEPARESPVPPGILWMNTWQEIGEYFFGAR